MWLYQLNQTTWPPEIFRRDIWEGQPWHFRCGQIRCGDNQISSRKPGAPTRGDVVVFFYCATDGKDHGIYGWGVVDRIEENRSTDLKGNPEFEDRLYFIPSAPTNHLKMDPWWDGEGGEVEKLARKIREPFLAASMYLVTEADNETERNIRNGIKKWLCSCTTDQ